MNKVILIGNIVKDITLQEYENGSKCYFRLAVNKTKDNTLFIDCVAWNQTAVFLTNYCPKGTKIGLEGQIDIYSKQNQDGTYTDKWQVLAFNVEILGKPVSSEAVNNTMNNAEKNFTQNVSQKQNTNHNQNEIDDDKLPF